MTALDSLTAEQLLEILPDHETVQWEYKDASVLQDKSTLKEKLSQQVSAFANSGGGHLVFGLSKDRIIQPCEKQVKRQSMYDYLSQLTNASVLPNLQNFKIHTVPIENSKGDCIYVIEIGDSALAPHQASDQKYYTRIPGHSIPATHFQVDLLFKRFRSPILEIKNIFHRFQGVAPSMHSVHATVMLNVSIINSSPIATSGWKLIVRLQNTQGTWYVNTAGDDSLEPDGSIFIRPDKELFFGESTMLSIPVNAEVDRDVSYINRLAESWSKFACTIVAVTSNSICQEAVFDSSKIPNARNEMRRELTLHPIA